MNFLWTFFVYALLTVVISPSSYVLITVLLSSFGLMPEESLYLLGIDSSGGDPNFLILSLYLVLFLLLFFVTLGRVFRALSRVKSQSRSVRTRLAPFPSSPEVKGVFASLNWTMFWLPVSLFMKIIVPLNFLLTLGCVSLATFTSGYPGYGIAYFLSALFLFEILNMLTSNDDGFGGAATQLDKDANAIAQNHLLAETKREKIKLQKKAMEQQQEAYEKLLEQQRLRDLAYERDHAERREK